MSDPPLSPRPRDDEGYAIAVHGVEQPVTRSDVERLFSEGEAYREVTGVRTPESGGLVPPARSDLAVGAFARRLRRAARASATTALLLVVGGVLAVTTLPLGGREERLALWILLAAFAGLPLVADLWTMARAKAAARARLADLRSSMRLSALVWRSRPVATWTILAALVVVFVFARQAGNDPVAALDRAIRAAGLVKSRVAAEPWRCLTGAVLHAHELHVAMNVMALASLGRLVEGLVTRSHVVVVFVASAVAASLCSWWLVPAASVGASGGLMGLLGFATVLAFGHRRELPRSLWRALVVNVALMAAIGVVAARWVDNAAHGGGFVAGALLGWLLGSPRSSLPLRAGPALRAAGVVCAAAVAAAVAWTLRLLA
jgi:membrane associated rhomboid family serine protease